MLEQLISSQARLAIMSLFFKNKDKKYYAREVVKSLNLDQANVHKELANLLKGGFLTTETTNGKKYFFANQQGKLHHIVRHVAGPQEFLTPLKHFALKEDH